MATDLLQVVVWLTPAGTLDDGGVKQPAYLNFEVSLLGPPAGNEMKVGPFRQRPPEMTIGICGSASARSPRRFDNACNILRHTCSLSYGSGQRKAVCQRVQHA